jgi:hypothetical protein
MKFGISNLRFQIPNSRFQISNSKFGVSTAEIDMVVGDLLVWRGGGFLGVPRVALFRTFLLPLVDRVYIVRALDVRLKRIGWRTGIAAGQLRSANLLLFGVSRLLLHDGAAENRASQGVEFGHIADLTSRK